MITLLLLLIPAISLANNSSTITISSQYTDESNNEIVPINGSGFFVEYKDKLFAVTAAHVSQGKNTKITAKNSNIEILGRLSDNTSDIEILEVPKNTGIPFVTYRGNYPPDFYVNVENAPNQNLVELAPFVYALQPINSKKAPTSSTEFSKNILGGESIYVHGKIVAGMSGSPVIENTQPPGSAPSLFTGMEKNKITLKGIVTSYSRDFDGSYIATSKKMKSILDNYISGARGTINSTMWNMRKKLTYRKFAEGFSEIPSEIKVAGDAETSDGGDAETADGGNIVANSSAAGIEYQNKHVVAFLIKDKVENITLPIYANSSGAMLTSIFPDRYETIKPIVEGESLKLIQENIPFSTGIYKISGSEGKNLFSLHPNAGNLYYSRCLTSSRTNSSLNKRDLIEIKNDKISVQIPGCHGDIIQFHLDRQGRVIGEESKGFQPILKIKGEKTGKEYVLDIKNLFFADISKIKTIQIGRYENDLDARKNFFDKLTYNTHFPKITIKEPFEGNNVDLIFEKTIPVLAIISNFFEKKGDSYIWNEILTSKTNCNPTE